ncbi:MAG: mechanosensitive ion channel domain-containing protein, partial [Bdellovibrionia bacterium]
FKRLMKWVETGKPFWYGALLEVIQKPLNLVVVSVSIGVALQAAPPIISEHIAARTASKILLILSIFWLIDRAAALAIRSGSFGAKLTEATKAIFLSISRVFVVVLSLLIVLDTLGISITPLLASLGVGSVAIALALQDTLSNFFGGVYVLVDKPIRVGDMVRIEDGTEGIVRRIGWRSSHIEVGGTNIVVIPNTKLASSIVTNYDLPTSEVNLTLPIGVSYDCDLEEVEKTAIAVAKEAVMKAQGGVATVEPIVRFTSFADSSINFNLIVRARSFAEAAVVRHELIKAVHARFQRDGIEIPYPQRTIRVLQSPAAQASRPSATPN